MPSYLQKRRRRWYAVHEIPKALRPQFGKPRFVQSLETESRTVAERRVLQVVAGWKGQIATARNEPDDIVAWSSDLGFRGENYSISANASLRALRNAKTKKEREMILEGIDELCQTHDKIAELVGQGRIVIEGGSNGRLSLEHAPGVSAAFL